MEEWLDAQLSPFDLNSPDIIDYLIPIIEDENETIGDIIESCQEFLEASMGDDADLTPFLEDLQKRIEESRSGKVSEVDVVKEKMEQKRKQEEIEAQKAEEELAKIEKQRAEQVDKPLTPEERAERKRLRQIAAKYDGEMQLDANGDFVYTGIDGDDEITVCNENVERVKDQQSKTREQEKKKHSEKVKRDKEALEKDKLRKEKAKKGTQKKEKRRGR